MRSREFPGRGQSPRAIWDFDVKAALALQNTLPYSWVYALRFVIRWQWQSSRSRLMLLDMLN